MSDPFDDLADVLVGAFGANPEQQAVSQWLSTGCGSAWKKDPVSGVIGVQTGPL